MNTEEDNVIFKIERVGDTGSSVHFTPQSESDLFAVALAIYQVFDKCPDILARVGSIEWLINKDENFRNLLDKSTLDLPDFNKLLKD